MLYDYTEILRQAESFAELLLAGLNQKTVDFRPKTMVNLSVRSTPSFQQRADLFCEELEYLKKNHFCTLILAGSGTRAQRMAKELQEMGLEAVYIDSLEKEVPKGAVWVARGTLSKGFRYDYIDFAVFCDSELFGGKEKKKRKKRRKNGAAIESFTDLHIGDYVVHDNHGDWRISRSGKNLCRGRAEGLYEDFPIGMAAVSLYLSTRWIWCRNISVQALPHPS